MNQSTFGGFYFFVCMESRQDDSSRVELTAAALVDGNLLNADFDFYLSIVGERKKRIGLGTYRNGADRARPMLIFANPLGIVELDNAVTLIHPSAALHTTSPTLRMVYEVERTVAEGKSTSFHCYRLTTDVPADWVVSRLIDPFPTPVREARTRPRGRFKLPFRV